ADAFKEGPAAPRFELFQPNKKIAICRRGATLLSAGAKPFDLLAAAALGAVKRARPSVSNFPPLEMTSDTKGSAARRAARSALRWKPCSNLSTGAPKSLCRLSSRFECGCSLFRRHGNGRLNIRQTASSRSSQYRRGCRPLIGELANGQP